MKRFITFLLTLLILVPFLRAEETTAPPRKDKRPTVALVLSGGGAKGMAHIGVLKVIEELGIPVDYVVGTSIGSIIGGLYALGYDAQALDSLVRAQDWDLLMRDEIDRQDISYSSKENNDRFVLSIPFYNRDNLREKTQAGTDFSRDVLRNVPGALVEGQYLDQLFTKLSVNYQDDIDFNTLPIPFACVSVDLNTREEVVWHRGDIVTAMRSSMSIPGYFEPVRIGDRYLVDGGVLNNLPVDVAREMGADYVISVDLNHFKKSRPDSAQTIPEMFSTLLGIMNGVKYDSGRASSDILIEPNTSAYGMMAFDDYSVSALVDSGWVAARQLLPQLQSLADKLNEYPEPDEQRPAPAVDLNHHPILISQMEIHGTNEREIDWLLKKTGIGPGMEITGADMDKAIGFIYSTRCFTKATYDVAGTEEEGYSLKIHLEPQRIHEAAIGFRFDSEEMPSILLGLGLNRRKLFGSALSIEAKLGTNAFAWMEYAYTFRNLTRLSVSSEWQHFSQDAFDRLPDPVSAKDKYQLNWTDRYDLFNADAAYHITGWRDADISFGVHYNAYKDLVIDASSASNAGEASFAGSTLGGFFKWKFDGLDNSYLPGSGLKADLSANVYCPVEGAATEDGWFYGAEFDLKAAIPLGERVTLIPQTWNRWMFSGPDRLHKNYVGGSVAGRYLDTQMPFIGINRVHQTFDRTDIVRADLRFNLIRQHYLTLTGNYLFEWEPGRHSGCFGAGAAYTVNTFIGPISLLVHGSTLSRRVGFYFSLGFDF